MRVLPRSRWGQGLALVAVVLISLDVMTEFYSLRVVGNTPRWLQRLSVTFCSGCINDHTNDSAIKSHEGVWQRDYPRRWWFHTSSWAWPGVMNWRETFVPLWHVYLPIVVGLVFLERRHARRGRAPLGCKACGYDLVGLPPEAVCPECGQTRA